MQPTQATQTPLAQTWPAGQATHGSPRRPQKAGERFVRHWPLLIQPVQSVHTPLVQNWPRAQVSQALPPEPQVARALPDLQMPAWVQPGQRQVPLMQE